MKHVQRKNKCVCVCAREDTHTYTVFTPPALLNILGKTDTFLFDAHTGMNTHTHINSINSACEALSLSRLYTHTHTPMKIIDVLSYKTVAAP